MDALNFFKYVLLVHLFFGISITIITYTLPSPFTINEITMFTQQANTMNIETTTKQMQEAVTTQSQIPFVTGPGLLWNSGRIVLDLIFNTVTAVPKMITLLITAAFLFFGVDPTIIIAISTFIFGVVIISYVLIIIAFIMNLLSGAKISLV